MGDSTNELGLGNAFMAWCLDLITTIKDPAGYTINNTNPFSNRSGSFTTTQVGNIQKVFDANYDSFLNSSSATKSAAFQVALWEVIYETGTVGDAGNGSFKLDSTYNVLAPDVITQANSYLSAALSYTMGAKLFNLNFLQSTGEPEDSQNLVTASPVPLPAAGLLLFGAMGALGVASRRRKASAEA